MLKGEALYWGKKWRRQLEEGQALFADREELKQFLDVAIWAIERGQND